jgi:hypothetical protein
MVIASSYAALNPSKALWREYLGEVDRRRDMGELTDDEYHFLRSSREARQALMDQTLGDEEAFSAGTFDEVVAHAKAQIQAEARAETEVERAAKLAAQDEARKNRKLANDIDRVHHDKVDRQAHIAGLVVGWCVAIILGLAVVIGVLATIPTVPLIEVTTTFWRIVIWACLAAFVVISIYTAVVKHISVLAIQRLIADNIERQWRGRGYRRLDALHASATSQE